MTLHVGNADDGSWKTLSRGGLTQEKAEQLIVRAYENLREYRAWPSEEALLEIIQPLGLWFTERK